MRAVMLVRGLAVLSCALASLAPPLPAPAAVRAHEPDLAIAAPGEVQYGVHSMLPATLGSAQVAAVLDQAQASGATWVRLNLEWPAVSPRRGTFQHARLDGVVKLANQRGLKVLGTVNHTPDWASGDPRCPDACTEESDTFPPRDYRDWAAFAAGLAAHYATACKADGLTCVRAYEIWNEPTLPGSWAGTPEQYAHLLSVASDAIHAASPGALVVLGGLTDNGPSDEGQWVRRVMTNPRFPAAGKIDVPAVHIRGTATFVQRRAAKWRAEFDAYPPLAAKPLWVTEHGYPSTPDDQSDPLYAGADAAAAEQAQARYYNASLPGLAAAGAEAIFVTLEDNPRLKPPQFVHEGLVKQDLATRKAAFALFRSLATGGVGPADPG
jgi:polysaccharide biosynthesis protein PslG